MRAIRLAVVLLVVALAAPGTAAAQLQPLHVWLDDFGLGSGRMKLFREDPGMLEPVRAQVVRDGEVIADEVGGAGFLEQTTELFVDPLPGDVVRLFDPATAAEPLFTHVYDGRPSLGACPAGSRTIDARVLPAAQSSTSIQPVGVVEPVPGQVASGPLGSATLTHARPVAAGDRVFLSSTRATGDVELIVTTARTAGECAGPVVPPRPTIADGRVFLTRASTLATVFDVRRGFLLPLPMGCDRGSRVPCRGNVRLQTVPTRPGQQVVEVGRDRVDFPAGGRFVPFLDLDLSVQRILHAGRETRLRAIVDIRDTVGGLVRRTRTYRVIAGPL